MIDMMGLSIYGGPGMQDEIECSICNRSIFATESSMLGQAFINSHSLSCVRPYQKARDRYERKIRRRHEGRSNRN